jgi:aldehyde:ferredoxin oxidoreductase
MTYSNHYQLQPTVSGAATLAAGRGGSDVPTTDRGESSHSRTPSTEAGHVRTVSKVEYESTHKEDLSMIHATGPMLSVDVGTRDVREIDVNEECEAFLGGRGLATKLAHDRIPFDADPLGADNRAYVSTGPLQQSQMSFTGRMNMTALSPLTDGLVSSNAGGYLSRNFAGTGHPVVELRGSSDELLAVHVTDDGVTFEAVPELAEAHVPEITEEMNDRHGLESENLLAIGPAGENTVRFASVMTYDSRAFGRGGIGAVLGAKNIKVVSFEGDSQPSVELPDEPQGRIHREAATTDDMMKRQGTTAGTQFINDNFSLPTRYFSEMSFEDVEEINGDAVEDKKYKKAACSMCAFACKLPTRDEETGVETEGPEYETVMSFGSNQGIDDIVDVMQANELCDRLGMDTISAGVTVAAYLAAEDEFGNAELVQRLVPKIAHREGVGDLLAEGVSRAHSELGVDDWSVKGLEFAAHDGRVLHGQGLSYAVANRGADHMYGNMLNPEYDGIVDPEGLSPEKIEMLIHRENKMAVRDSGVICAFGMGDYVTEDDIAALFETDWDRLDDLGSRVIDLERHFNNQRGIDRTDDCLPYELPEFESALDRYYDRRGWTDRGTVTADTDSPVSAAD